MTIDTPAVAEMEASGLDFEVVHYEPAGSLPEAARRRRVPVGAIVKTMVVRRGDDDYLLVLVPGDRGIDWAKLRSHLGVSRLSMPDAAEANAATGYERGTITPLGLGRRWPVLADVRVADRELVSIGGGAHSVAIHMSGDDLVRHVGATVADVTKAAAPPG